MIANTIIVALVWFTLQAFWPDARWYTYLIVGFIASYSYYQVSRMRRRYGKWPR